MQNTENLFGPKKLDLFTIDDFWIWFERNQERFSRAIRTRNDLEELFFDPLSGQLAKLRSGIFFLAGELDETAVELILTPDGNIKNIELIERIVAAAPTIEGWKFTAFKPAQNIENVSIQYREYKFSQDQLFFYSNDTDQYPDLINLTIVHSSYNDENKRIIENGTYLFLDMYIGELNSVSIIDHIDFCNKEDAEKELVPIGKLNAFLNWRNKEFVEQYEELLRSSEEDKHSLFEGQNNDGSPMIAVINTDVLRWENKASHPWILKVIFEFDGAETNGFPSPETSDLLDAREEGLNQLLEEAEGYINIGRQTGTNQRQVYFACKDFRKPSNILHNIIHNHMHESVIHFEIYKDKYWRTFEQFIAVK